MDREFTTTRGILVAMATEDPNTFLGCVSNAGLEDDDIEGLEYLVDMARRAPGYDVRADMLRIRGVC